MEAVADYHALRQRLLTALESAADAQDSGDLAAVDAGYDELDAMLPRNAGSPFDKLHIALEFWDGWIDARNHDWLYYEGILAKDWPRLAREIVDDLRHDREVRDERVLQRFDPRRRASRPSLWRRLRNVIRAWRAV